MYASTCKSDGLPKAGFGPVSLTDEVMDRIAQAMGCAVESMMFEPYPT